MSKYATISVPIDVKKRLEKAKGEREWGEFLLELYTERRLLKSKRAFEELSNLLSDQDIDEMAKSSEEFREKFSFT
jgi:predicted CopG family antitoxin